MPTILTADQFTEFYMGQVQDYVKDISTKVYEGVVLRSPVYTGTFRYNWKMTKGDPEYSFIEVGSPSNPEGAPVTPTLTFGKKEFPIVYIVNSSPYADLIEHGSSTQAPNGVVSVTLASLGL